MFTHADFNRGGKPICRSWIGRWGTGGLAIGTLWRFESGDLAWWVRGQYIAWPSRVHIYTPYGRGSPISPYALFDVFQFGQLGTRINGKDED